MGADVRRTGGGYTQRMAAESSVTPRGYTASKEQLTKRLHRIEGQVRGIEKMVAEDRYCIDVITQIQAVKAALRRVEEEMLRDHVSHCVEEAIRSGDAKQQRQKVAELMQVLGRRSA